MTSKVKLGRPAFEDTRPPDFTKQDFIDAIVKSTILTRLEGEEVYFDLIDSIEAALIDGRTVVMPRIGKLNVKRRPPRRHFLTFTPKEGILKPAHRVVLFKVSKFMYKAVRKVLPTDDEWSETEVFDNDKRLK